MSQNRYKCSGKDAKKNETLRDKTPKKDVELCLEVEMDDEVKEIITSPEKCTSTLLDVTVIKPKDLDQYCAHRATLSGDEVRKLIASMELEKQDKQKLINRILSADPKSSGDYVKKKFVKKMSAAPKVQRQRTSTTDETNSDPVYNYKQKLSKKCDEHVEQVYTTPKTYNDIKSIFTCKNKNKYDENEKPDRPCLCRNCAIVGVLTDSQKKPFVTENLYDPRELLSHNRKDSKDNKRKKCVNFKEDPDDHIECEYYFRHLFSKIRRLEERLAMQEEKSVPRDYFKRIITKLVTHLSKITSYAGYDNPNGRPKSKDAKDSYRVKERYGESKYYVHPVLVDQKFSKSELDEFLPTIPNDKCHQPPDGFWKWGEEILKPGIDLKNKIVMLLEETLINLKKPRSLPGVEKILGANVEIPQKMSAEVPVRDVPVPDKLSCPCKNYQNVSNNHSGSTLSKLKNSRSYEKRGKKFISKQDCFYEDLLNVSYMNPQTRKWDEESQISFKFDSSDLDSFRFPDEKKFNDIYKSEFKETLSNTKESDKLKLWHSVWTQAKINGQNKNDKVTIQLPDRKNAKNNRTIEIEYTIAELEELLVGNSHSNHKHSSKKRSDKK